MGNQQSFDFDVSEEQACAFNAHPDQRACTLSAGWKLHHATRTSTGERVSALRFDKVPSHPATQPPSHQRIEPYPYPDPYPYLYPYPYPYS